MSNEQIVIQIKAGLDTGSNMARLCKGLEGFIKRMSFKYQGIADIEDLQQEGYLSLYDAIEGWNPDRGVKFLSYAGIGIQRAMERYISSQGSIRIPEYKNGMFGKYERLRASFLKEYGREPYIEEAAGHLNLSLPQMERFRKDYQKGRLGSLDAPLPGDGDITLGDVVPDTSNMEASIIGELDRMRMEKTLWGLVDSLGGHKAAIIRYRYKDGLTIEAAGGALGVGKEGARREERRALGQLRSQETIGLLRPYYEEYLEAACYRHLGADTFRTTWTSVTEGAAYKRMEYTGKLTGCTRKPSGGSRKEL